MARLVLDEPIKKPRLVPDETDFSPVGSVDDLPEGELDKVLSVFSESEKAKAKINNALYYSNQFQIPPDIAYDNESALNKIAFNASELSAEPGKMFKDAILQSLASKPAMMLRGTEVYTPGKALGLDNLLDKASTYLDSLKDPKLEQKLQAVASGKLWPIGENRRWWQVERKYLPEVINAWAANVGDQIPILLTTWAGRMAGKALGKPIAALAGGTTAMATAGPDPSDVVTAPAAVAITQEVIKHLGGAAPLIAMEAGAFMDDSEYIADEQGNPTPIDADISEKYARLYGVGSGVIEYAQQLWVLGRYSKISKPAQASILKQVLSHIGGASFEGLEEISQGGLENYLLQKSVAEMKERYPEYKGVAPNITEGWKRNGAIGTGVAFITAMPGTGMSISRGAAARMAQVKPETKKFLGEPSVQEIKQAEEAPVTPEKPETKAIAPKTEGLTPEQAAEAIEQEVTEPVEPAEAVEKTKAAIRGLLPEKL